MGSLESNLIEVLVQQVFLYLKVLSQGGCMCGASFVCLVQVVCFSFKQLYLGSQFPIGHPLVFYISWHFKKKEWKLESGFYRPFSYIFKVKKFYLFCMFNFAIGYEDEVQY